MPDKRSDVVPLGRVLHACSGGCAAAGKDPNTQVRACIADTNHRILSVGYNGTPSALNDDDFRGA